MSRPTVEVADILRAQGNRFLDRYKNSFDFQQLKAFRAISSCRTAALGGHIDACPGCGYQAAISYNSCRNRHCPKCQTQLRERWLAARERELLATSYFHVVFTVPHELNALALDNASLFYGLLFAASAQTLLEVAADPKHLGAAIGVISILHTWGQNLLLHPHVHCAIPAGGLSADHNCWVHPHYLFFLPVKVLSRVFRGKFCAGLKRLYRRKRLRCAGPASALAKSQAVSVSFCAGCTGKTGSSMPNPLSGTRCRCSATSAGTPIAWPSPITGCWHLMGIASRSAGRTIVMAASSER
jgi:Transposase zinc-binding domain/Putative transposase